MHKKVKIGFIGCGKITQVRHAPCFLKMAKKAKITGLYDLNPKTAQKLNKDLSLKASIYSSSRDLLASGIQGVVISTPNISHYSLSMQALKAGIHVLVEKPMAVNLKQADMMIETAHKKKLVLQVNQSFRFNPVHNKIKTLIDSGEIGEIVHVRCLRAGGNTPDKGWAPGSTWFVQKKFRGGLIMDLGVHMADLLGWLVGKAKSVYSINSIRIHSNNVPDNVTAILEFANRVTGVLELSWTIPCGGILLEIYGSKGAIRVGFNEKNKLELASKNKIYKAVKVGKGKSYQSWFVDSINGVKGNPSLGEVGRHALAYCMAIEKSGRTGKPVVPNL